MTRSNNRAQLLAEFDAAPEWAWFDQRTIAAVRDCSEATLERDRWAGTGIPFVKDGRSVKYIKSDVLEFLRSQKPVRSTAGADTQSFSLPPVAQTVTRRKAGKNRNPMIPRRTSQGMPREH